MVLKLNGIAGISVKDKLGGKKEEAEERQSDGQENKIEDIYMFTTVAIKKTQKCLI